MATGKPGQRGVPKKKKGGGGGMKGSARVTRAGGRDFEMENSKTDQWWGFKKNRCICLCGTFGRAGKGAEVARMVGKGVCGQRSFLEWDGRILRGRGLLVFFGGS